jgi:hypothetical protein
MQHTTFVWTKQYSFKPLLLGHLLRLFIVFVLGAGCLLMYAATRDTRWLVTVGALVVLGTILLAHYNAQSVIICDDEIIVTRWLRQPVMVPIALNDLETRQGSIGRLFDCGSLYVQLNGKDCKLASIGTISAFNGIVAERYNVIRQLLVARRQQIQAEDREIGALLQHMRPQALAQ